MYFLTFIYFKSCFFVWIFQNPASITISEFLAQWKGDSTKVSTRFWYVLFERINISCCIHHIFNKLNCHTSNHPSHSYKRGVGYLLFGLTFLYGLQMPKADGLDICTINSRRILRHLRLVMSGVFNWGIFKSICTISLILMEDTVLSLLP